MTFQTSVQRQYTTGFPGELAKDGPTRAKQGRINSVTIGNDPGASTNRISRAFGFGADIPATGTTKSEMGALVVVGAPVFYGILANPKHYALQGTSSGGTLAPSLDLPIGADGEFVDMATGLISELFNETTGAKTMNFGDQVAYVMNTITALQNPLALPYGALVSVAPGFAAPAGMVLIPNARVINPGSLAASALGALVTAYTVIQLTQ
jgi:hypothetical protein